MATSHINKNTRVIFLLLTLGILVVLHRLLTHSWLPSESNTTFIFLNLLLLVILGSLVIEDKFTKPADALVNSLAVIITLFSIKVPYKFIAWKLNLAFAILIFLTSILAMLFSEENRSKDAARNKVAFFFYSISTFFGNSNVIFSITFLFSLFSFYSSQQVEFLILMCFWAFIIIAKPLGILNLLQNLTSFISKGEILESGKIVEVMLPGLIRFEPFKDIDFSIGEYIVLKDSGIKVAVITDSYHLTDKPIVQAVVVDRISLVAWKGRILEEKRIYRIGGIEEVSKLVDDKEFNSRLKRFIGLVVENSNIGEINFRVTSSLIIEEGNILEAYINDQKVLFQIVNAQTSSELLSNDLKCGIVKGFAQQVGIWNQQRVRFDKFGWVPPMHTPLFLIDKSFKVDCEIKPNELVLGYIPSTNFPIIADVNTLITHHTAILGITGSGKTELAFTIIQKMIDLKAKVFCVDFTGDYTLEFSRFAPRRLAISSQNAQALNEKMLAVETGQYGAGKEIAELEKFKSILVPEIEHMVKEFIESDDHLAVFELSEIANTSATIAITEFYLSQIFSYARQHRGSGQKYCIVLEEAHTVIPESQTMGVQDKFSKATISKISQIALQGRKYNVGLLVIAQRTANVTKTVLNQCNSVIVFNSYDKTGFDFLENYVGPGMISSIPNLKWLHGMVVGRGFKSGRPLIMEIPVKDKYKTS